MKRGQATIYVILGLVFVIIIGVLFYFIFSQGEETSTISTLGQQSEQVKLLIENCFEENLLQALYLAGVQGGYIKLPEKSIGITSELGVAYGYYQGEDLLVSKENFALEVTDYLNFAVTRCADFSRFTDFNVQVISDARSRLEISDDNVVGKLYYPIRVSKGSEVVTYEELYVIEHPIRLGKMLTIAKGIVESEKNNPDYVDIDYLKESVEGTGFNMNLYDDIAENEILYVISDEQSVVNGVEYVFQFANKF